MTTKNQTEKKHPTHNIFYTTDKADSDKKNWNKTGVAWLNEETGSMNISLNLFGQKISLVVLKYQPRES
ncbi:hypothetical protein DYBT9275_04897 [Dyadobacter sp. CECT 9275]|uniref:Uncharacterized protein n=2 Tax=Dyadobacter helix TaxID=2822344 RepID=A0A916JGU0_9BACT|nr:hypothetical protein DYBT9275_04897 [Dyadobacter sp. CECT 9275]